MKSTLKAKLQRAYSKTRSMFALTLFMFFICWMPASQAACAQHDHMCAYHVGDATVRAGAAANTGTSLVMYTIGTNLGTTTASTLDFDTGGKAPAMTGDKFLVGSPINYTTPTGPYIVNSTAYGTTHPPATWSTPGDTVLQIHPSQYQLTFNQNTAIAKHTGDFNGGENGNIPGATGCPNMPAGTKNCEAVVVTGNVPNGIYEQKATLFNYFNAPNPQVQLQVGAYTTGRAVIISNSHESKEQAYFPILSGTGATTPAYQYEVNNLGFDPHAKGTALFDQNKYSTRYSNTYEAGDHRFRDAYFTTLTTHNKVNADGWNDKTYTAKTSVEKQYMGEVPKPTVPKVFCTDGKSSISCGTPGAVDYNSQAARALEQNFNSLKANGSVKNSQMPVDSLSAKNQNAFADGYDPASHSTKDNLLYGSSNAIQGVGKGVVNLGWMILNGGAMMGALAKEPFSPGGFERQVKYYEDNRNIWKYDNGVQEAAGIFAQIGFPVGGATSAIKPTTSTVIATTSSKTSEILGAGVRGIGDASGKFSAVPNIAGGTVFISNGGIVQSQFVPIVNSAVSRGDKVNILSGVHGTIYGGVEKEVAFLTSDINKFGALPNVRVYDYYTMSTKEITDVLNSTDITIGAFCFSGKCLDLYLK